MTPAILLLASVGVGLTALRETYGVVLTEGDRRMLEQMERDVDEVLQMLRRQDAAKIKTGGA